MRFWGVRGSIPSPGAETCRYGGNTPCIEMRCGEELLIFDLGSGARPLADSLRGPNPVRASVFLSHYHYDHLQGLPFFGPIFNPRNSFTFYGAVREGLTAREVISRQMLKPYFPVAAEEVFRAQIRYEEIRAGQEVVVGPGVVKTSELNHPGGNLGFRVECGGRSVVYATDVEHGHETLDAALWDFARGADVLIMDAMYTEDEYLGRVGSPKIGWGHATWQAAVRAAQEAQVKQLVLFHHDPSRSDEALERMLEDVRKHRPEAIAARESQVLEP